MVRERKESGQREREREVLKFDLKQHRYVGVAFTLIGHTVRLILTTRKYHFLFLTLPLLSLPHSSLLLSSTSPPIEPKATISLSLSVSLSPSLSLSLSLPLRSLSALTSPTTLLFSNQLFFTDLTLSSCLPTP